MESTLIDFKPHYDKCGFCGEEYWMSRHWHRFCKTRCRTLAWRRKHVVMDSEVLERISRLEDTIKQLGIK